MKILKHILLLFATLLPVCLFGYSNMLKLLLPTNESEIHESEFFTWSNVYDAKLYKDCAAEFLVSNNIPSNTKALILHGVGTRRNVDIELNQILALKDIEHLSISGFSNIEPLHRESYQNNLKKILPWIISLKKLKTLNVINPDSMILHTILECKYFEALHIRGEIKIDFDSFDNTKIVKHEICPKLNFIKISGFDTLSVSERIPKIFFNLKIETLIVTDIANDIPDYVYKFLSLKKMHLGKNGVLKLSPDLAKLDYLQELSFSCHHRPRLPDEVRQMKSLNRVSINDSQINEDRLYRSEFKTSGLIGMNLKTLYIHSDDAKYVDINGYGFISSIEELYISTAGKVSLNMSTLQNLKTLVINGSVRVEFFDVQDGPKRFDLFQIYSIDPSGSPKGESNGMAVVKNWYNLFRNVKSFKSIALINIDLHTDYYYNFIADIDDITERLHINTNNLTIDANILKSDIFNIFDIKSRKINVLPIYVCWGNYLKAFLSDCDEKRFSRKYKNLEYHNSTDSLNTHSSIIYARGFPEINLTK